MVKRTKTPEPGDDEPKYFTVVQPYPLHANWEYDQDYITCARWLAGALGSDAPIYAIFHKPSARGMILIEVEKTYDSQIIRERLLGEHKWSEFLISPSPEEEGRVTQIFYSFYTVGRDAQKDGWKRIHIHQHYFNTWTLNNHMIRQPYPKTSWCPVPQEDITNKAMCRPIPTDPTAPKPVVAPRPVVGSADWVNNKSAPQPTAQGAWTKKPVSNLSAKSSTFKPSAGQHVMAPKPVPVPEANFAPKSAWTKPITVTAGAVPGIPPNKPNAWAAKGATTPVSPPGLPIPPNLSHDAIRSSPSLQHITDAFVGITMSESQEADLYGIERSPDINGSGYVADYELKYNDPKAIYTTEFEFTTNDSGVENLWSDPVVVTPAPKPDEVVCPIHKGKQCKKGICEEYAKALKAKQQKDKAAKRAQEPKNTGGKGKKGTSSRNGNAWDRNDSPGVDDDGFAKVSSKKRGGGNRHMGSGPPARSFSSSSRGNSVEGSAVGEDDDPWS